MWDIFPPVCDDWNDHKLIRLVLFNEKETKKVISTWGRKQQNCSTLTNELALGGRPQLLVNKFGSAAKPRDKFKNGVRVALQLLTENSEAQEHVRQKESAMMINRGRIVCLTQTDDDLGIFAEEVAAILKKELSEINSTAAGSSMLSSIAQLEVNVVCCYAGLNVSSKQQVSEEISRQISHSVNLVITSVPAGMELSR